LLGQELPQDYELAVYFLSKAAASGDVYASFQLGNLYLGGIGVEKSISKAKELIKFAADQGDNGAQLQLAGLLLMTEDTSEGVAYLEKLAEHGDQEAMLKLADVLIAKKFGIQNDELAFKWYKNAATAGNTRGQLMAARCLWHGIGTAADKVKAVEFYRKAIDNGSTEAEDELRKLEK
jgi:TPR repeat protein